MAKRAKKSTKRERKQARFSTVSPVWTPFEQHVPPPEVHADKLFVNSRYHVFVREIPHPGLGPNECMTHLSIKRNDREVLHDWRDLQRIKNEICGPECEAVEVYPAESRLVDASNQYHLWVMPEGKMVPFGFFEGRLVSESDLNGSKQRSFEEAPSGVTSREELARKVSERMLQS